MGTARITPTIPLKSRPNLASSTRLEDPVDVIMELLALRNPRARSARARREIEAAAPPARRQRRRFPAATWVCRGHYSASPARPVRAVQQLRPFEDPDHLPAQGMSD